MEAEDEAGRGFVVDVLEGVEGVEGVEGGVVGDAFNEGVKGFKSVAVVFAFDKLADERLADDGLAFVVASYGHDLAFVSCAFIAFAARLSLARITAKSMPFDLALTRTSVKICLDWAVSLERSSFPAYITMTRRTMTQVPISHLGHWALQFAMDTKREQQDEEEDADEDEDEGGRALAFPPFLCSPLPVLPALPPSPRRWPRAAAYSPCLLKVPRGELELPPPPPPLLQQGAKRHDTIISQHRCRT